MFVVDAGKGGSEFAATIHHISDVLSRNGAQIERIEKWDERKLAYPIGKSKRGIYILVYFLAEGSAISEIRTAFNLSEQVLRVLILSAEAQAPPKGALYGPDGEPAAAQEAPAAETSGDQAEPAEPEPEEAPAAPEPDQEAETPEPEQTEEQEG
jgi:small subunit ribosomal protein S6